MVTQDPVMVPKMKKMKKKSKKKLKKKQKKGLEGPSTESEGDSLDLSEKLYPLAHYVSDQEELVNQMFATIHGPKLEAMLPPVLKSVPLKELKKLCLHELRGMSKKRILACINGQVMEGSSGSEDEDEELEGQAEKGNKPDEKAVVGKRKQLAEEEAPESYLLKKIKVEPGTEDNSPGAGKSSDTGKSVLELLELEMRARIIKTMLEKGHDGCKIAEDAIAAVMQSAKQITGEDPTQVKDLVNRDETGGREEEENEDREVERGIEKERSRSSRKSHRRRQTSKDNQRRRRERNRSEENHEQSHHSKQERKSRERKSKSVAHTTQRKKITRKEFQERMKRARENRTYRQRKTSEDEEKDKENKGEDEQQKDVACTQGEASSEAKKKITSDGETGAESKLQKEREEGDVDGSEKEEGEIDSNEEEEEGACSPSDISSRSSYYSYSRSYSSSRSRSRSYTRSPSPYRRRRSRSRGRRSYSRSPSRSPMYKGRHKQANHPPSRNSNRWTRNEQCQSYSKKNERDERTGRLKDNDISKEAPKPSQPMEPKEEEENWGQKCDIEFVDSDEDFDDCPDEPKKLQLGAVSQTSERASISFSLQKKPAPSITPGIDLDDLPRKKNLGKECTIVSDVGVIAVVQPPRKSSEEIVISSDSEGEISKPGSSVISSVSKQKESLSNSRCEHALIPDKTTQESGIKSDFDSKKRQPEAQQISGTNISKATVIQSKKERRQNIMQSETAEKIVCGIWRSEPQVQSNSNSDTPRNSMQVSVTSESASLENRPSAAVEGSEPNHVEDSRVSEHDVESNTSDSTEKIKDSDSLVAADSVPKYGYQETLELDVAKSAYSNQVNCDDRNGTQSEKLQPELSKTKGRQNEKLEFKISKNKGEKSEKLETIISESKECQSETLETKLLDSKGDQSKKLETNISETVEEAGHEDSQMSAGEEHSNAKNCNAGDSKKVSEGNKVKSISASMNVGNTEVSKLETDLCYKAEKVCEDNDANKGKSSTSEKSLNVTSTSSLQTGTSPENTVIDDAVIDNKAAVKNIQEPNDTENESKAVAENIQQPTEDSQKQENRMGGCTETNDKTDQVTETREDFYRGADQLEFSDEDDSCHDSEEFIRDDTPVEPIRIETGLISKPVVRREKIEIVAPEVSWTRKEKKKKEKTKGQLAMEGIGLIKSTLAENSAPASKELEMKLNERVKITEMAKTQSIVSDMDNSQRGDEPTGTSTPQTHEESPLVDINYETYEPKSDESSKLGDQETEIIGVIETSNDAGQNPMDDMDLGGASWSMRWLQSEKVQKVVSSSKMLSRVRKKIQRKEKEAKNVVEKTEDTQQPPQPQVPVIGSIEEYERLFGMKVKTSTEIVTDIPESSALEAARTTSETKSETEGKAAPIFGSDDEGEDSEEEALWSKILKK